MFHSSSTSRRLCLWAILLLFGAAQSHAQDAESRVWPAAPDTARIRYLGAIARGQDIGADRSFLEKLWDAIIGSETESDFFIQPVGIAVDDGGRIFVSDPGGSCIHMFDREEQEYMRITEGPDGLLGTPVGIAFADGRIYVTDALRKEVVVFDEDLDPEFSFPTGMSRPTGIASRESRIYITDTGEHVIGIFDLAGVRMSGFGQRGGEPGQFNYPLFLTFKRNLYVVDVLNHRIQVLDTAGASIRTFGTLGNVQGTFAAPKGIALDSDTNIYVVDALFDAFQIFDSGGRLLLVVGGSGSDPGSFQSPGGIWIDADNVIYVVDTLNKRVQMFQYLAKAQ
ncbi:MAG: hypothetical protein IH600_09535 [Bacteroidetes bacterium]|nr:hypothetical protein [Bacteroidota bacterium]